MEITSLAGACWAQTEDPSGCGAASPSQGRWDPDSLRPALRLGRSGLPFGPRSQASLQKAQGPGVCKLPKPPALLPASGPAGAGIARERCNSGSAPDSQISGALAAG